MKRDTLLSEINLLETNTPNVPMWVDQSSIFWLSESYGPVWLADHRGLDEYVNDAHQEEYRAMPEGVGNTGVIWMNADFENPYHISDFTDRIATINT